MRVLRVGIFMLLLAATSAAALYTIRSNTAEAQQAQVLAASVETVDAVEMSIMDKINKIRAESGVPTIAYSSAMKLLTTDRVADMSAQQYYSHTSPAGLKFGDVIKNYDPTSGVSCENLQLQVGDDWQAAVDAWVSSPAHYRCLINPNLTRGAGSVALYDEVSYGESSTSSQMYVLHLLQLTSCS